MTEQEKRAMFQRMRRGEIPYGPIDGEHPGSVGARIERERVAPYNAAVDSNDPEAWIRAMLADPRLSESAGGQRLLEGYRRDPDKYEIRGGSLKEKKNPFLQFLVNNPAVPIGAMIGGPLLFNALTGGGAAGAGAAGASGSSVPTIAGNAALQGLSGASPSIAGLGFGSSTIPGLVTANASAGGGLGAGTAAAGGGSILDRVLDSATPEVRNGVLGWLSDNWSDLAGLGLGVGAAAQGFREPQAQKDLERILGLAENRINQAEPLFDALVAMSQAQLPKYVRERTQ